MGRAAAKAVFEMNPILPTIESLTIEFKSGCKRLPDAELVEAVVCLANAEGGELWLGVEDDGTPTGLHPDHLLLAGLAGMVAARTSPSASVNVSPVEVGGVTVACIRVPKAQGEVATQGGVYLRRRIRHDGTPECAPMLPHERISRASRFGLVDVSAQPVAGATLADFDPLERERLRQAVQQYGGDRVLLELDDEALDGALGLTARQSDGSRLPTLTGLLLVGRESALHQRVPTHAESMGLCRLSEGQVKNLRKRMCKTGALILEGAGPAAHCRIGSSDRVVLDAIG